MAAGSVLAFWAVALLLVITPGADWAFTISAGLRGRSVFPAVSGLVLGYAAVTLVVATGVGALVAGSPSILTSLTLVGGAYLMWHGTTTFAHPATPATSADALGRHDLEHDHERHRGQRPQPERAADLSRSAPAVHRLALDLAGRRSDRPTGPDLYRDLRRLLLLPGHIRRGPPCTHARPPPAASVASPVRQWSSLAYS